VDRQTVVVGAEDDGGAVHALDASIDIDVI
jgi:hypothetical protein